MLSYKHHKGSPFDEIGSLHLHRFVYGEDVMRGFHILSVPERSVRGLRFSSTEEEEDRAATDLTSGAPGPKVC